MSCYNRSYDVSYQTEKMVREDQRYLKIPQEQVYFGFPYFDINETQKYKSNMNLRHTPGK